MTEYLVRMSTPLVILISLIAALNLRLIASAVLVSAGFGEQS